MDARGSEAIDASVRGNGGLGSAKKNPGMAGVSHGMGASDVNFTENPGRHCCMRLLCSDFGLHCKVDSLIFLS